MVGPVEFGLSPYVGYWPTALLAARTYGSIFCDKLTPSISSGKMVGSIRYHVAMEQWGDASQVNFFFFLKKIFCNRWAISRAEMGDAMNLRADWNDQPPGVPSVLDDQPDDRRVNVGGIHRVHQPAAKQAAIRQNNSLTDCSLAAKMVCGTGGGGFGVGVASATLSDSGAGGVAWVGGGAGMSTSKE